MENHISFGNKNLGLQVGISNGPITAQFSAPERLDIPPNPLSTVPFRRDPDFTDRGTLLDHIHKKCLKPASRVALVGLGGVGKSQLAIEYSYRIRDQSPETWALWIHGSTAARFEESCQDNADRLKIPGRKDSKVNIFQLICSWLNDERNGKWILFLDSVDHDRFLHEVPFTNTSMDGPESGHKSTGKPLSAYLPVSPNGSIILTTRSRIVASRLMEDNEIIDVQPMEQPHALALFGRKLGMQVNGEAIRKLAAALEFMPLAIVQAAAYIKRHCSVLQYLEMFLKSDRKKMSLLDKEWTDNRRDWQANNSIMVTWQISFDHIKEIRPSAADLLSLMSFFDKQGIERALLENQAKSGTGHGIEQGLDEDCANDDHEDNATESSINDAFQDDINTLCDYMLISSDRVTVEMRGLVQLAMRKWLKAHGQFEHWKGVFIRILTCQFPTGKYENWEQCQRLFRHARSAAALQQPKDETILRDWALLMYNTSFYAFCKGNIADSEEMAKKSMKARIQLFGPEHELTISSKEMLGMLYETGGRWKEAETIRVQVLEAHKRALGPKHPSTLISMRSLASIYQDQGQWKKAEKLKKQIIKIHKQILGSEHPGTLDSMGSLVHTWKPMGKQSDALTLMTESARLCHEQPGHGHPNEVPSASATLIKWQRESDPKFISFSGAPEKPSYRHYTSHIPTENPASTPVAHQRTHKRAIERPESVSRPVKRQKKQQKFNVSLLY